MVEILEKKFTVDSRDSDMFGYLRTSSLLGYLQNSATEHAGDLGVSRKMLMERYGAFWMMVRMWLKLQKPIKSYEDVTINTWHRGARGAIVHRDFDILVDGNPVGEAVTDWIIAGLEERNILKPASIKEFTDSAKPEKTKDMLPGKIVLPKDMLPCGTRTVQYSDTDINGHMNNTRYADIACDAVGLGSRARAYISEVQIGYLHECFPGEDILILKGEEEGYTFISGTDDTGKGRFDVKLKITEIQGI